eukprot:UN33081
MKLQKNDNLLITQHLHPQCRIHSYGSLIYEDELFYVINKPAGVIVQGDEDNNFLKYWRKKAGKKLVPMHRLDKPVSGVLIFAKSNRFDNKHNHLNKESTEKMYVARVCINKRKRQNER